MKTINKIILFFSLLLITLLTQNNFAYAHSFYKNDEVNFLFEIKSGIATGKDSTITTFDKTRTITGISEPGNKVKISVFQKVASPEDTEEDLYIEVYKYSLTVGSSGYFSQSIDLVIGENLVVITSSKEDQSASISTIIKRKKSEIKSQLESIIILPFSRN